MTNVTIPLELFEDLVENTIECLNAAANHQQIALMKIYQLELDQCKKIQDARVINYGD